MPFTHCNTFLEMFLAADEMGDVDRDIGGKGAPVDVDPFPHLLGRALLAKVAGNGDGEAFEGLFARCGTVGLVAVSLLHRGGRLRE